MSIPRHVNDFINTQYVDVHNIVHDVHVAEWVM